jgi:hypothetical protein
MDLDMKESTGGERRRFLGEDGGATVGSAREDPV